MQRDDFIRPQDEEARSSDLASLDEKIDTELSKVDVDDNQLVLLYLERASLFASRGDLAETLSSYADALNCVPGIPAPSEISTLLSVTAIHTLIETIQQLAPHHQLCLLNECRKQMTVLSSHIHETIPETYASIEIANAEFDKMILRLKKIMVAAVHVETAGVSQNYQVYLESLSRSQRKKYIANLIKTDPVKASKVFFDLLMKETNVQLKTELLKPHMVSLIESHHYLTAIKLCLKMYQNLDYLPYKMIPLFLDAYNGFLDELVDNDKLISEINDIDKQFTSGQYASLAKFYAYAKKHENALEFMTRAIDRENANDEVNRIKLSQYYLTKNVLHCILSVASPEIHFPAALYSFARAMEFNVSSSKDTEYVSRSEEYLGRLLTRFTQDEVLTVIQSFPAKSKLILLKLCQDTDFALGNKMRPSFFVSVSSFSLFAKMDKTGIEKKISMAISACESEMTPIVVNPHLEPESASMLSVTNNL